MSSAEYKMVSHGQIREIAARKVTDNDAHDLKLFSIHIDIVHLSFFLNFTVPYSLNSIQMESNICHRLRTKWCHMSKLQIWL